MTFPWPTHDSLSSWDSRFLFQAAVNASWSKDPSTKCGAVIASFDKTIMGQGFNGFPRRVKDDDRLLNRETKYQIVVHAEINSILNSTGQLKNCTIYTWPFPLCCRCSSFIIQAGLTEAYAPEPSRDILERWGAELELSSSVLAEAGVSLKVISQDAVAEAMTRQLGLLADELVKYSTPWRMK